MDVLTVSKREHHSQPADPAFMPRSGVGGGMVARKSHLSVGSGLPLFGWVVLAYAKVMEHSAEGDLETLVSLGCEKKRLLADLAFLMRDPGRIDTWQGLVGLESLKVKAAVQRMCKCADEIEALNSGVTARALMDVEPHYRLMLLLPKQLRLCAAFWRVYSKASMRPRAHPSLNAGKGRLTRYVIQKTGRVHDREVSALISAVIGRNYDAGAYGVWRRANRAYIQAASLT